METRKPIRVKGGRLNYTKIENLRNMKKKEKQQSNEIRTVIQDKATEMTKDKVKEAVMKSEIVNEAKETAKSGLWSIIKGIIGL